MGNLDNTWFENFRADLFSRTTSLRVIIVLIFAHFGVSARIRAKIYTNKVVCIIVYIVLQSETFCKSELGGTRYFII